MGWWVGGLVVPLVLTWTKWKYCTVHTHTSTRGLEYILEVVRADKRRSKDV